MTHQISNRTFDEIQIGESASLTRTVGEADVRLFAALSGDCNPVHLNHEFASASVFGGIVAHGLFSGALISTLLGVHLPGPGTIYLSQTFRFRRPVRPGDQLTATVTCREKIQERKRVVLECQCINQAGETVLKGEAEVIAPAEKIHTSPAPTPIASLDGMAFSIRS